MSVPKNFRAPVIAVAIFISSAIIAGCGGVSDAQFAELYALRDEVKSLDAEANRLKDERSNLEAQIQDINRSLAECNKQKEETRANLDKLPK